MDLFEAPEHRDPTDRIRAKDSALRSALAFVEAELDRRRLSGEARYVVEAACLLMAIEDALKW